MSLFITFEGGERAGKSTQAEVLCRRLSQLGFSVVSTFEPGGTALGEQVRRWLKEVPVCPKAELFLFAAARAQLVAEVISPALERGALVISDRYADSTLAYQGYGRGIDRGLIETINRAATKGIRPHLVVLLDLAPDEGRRRPPAAGNHFELDGETFHQGVRQGYLRLAQAEPERWLVIDATLPTEEIARIIWERVQPLLKGDPE